MLSIHALSHSAAHMILFYVDVTDGLVFSKFPERIRHSSYEQSRSIRCFMLLRRSVFFILEVKFLNARNSASYYRVTPDIF